MIILHTFGPAFSLPDPSPFVMKAEVLLKMANLPYAPQQSTFAKAPKGKLPFIEDDGRKIADSTFIRLHIEGQYGIDFDKALSAAQRAIAWSVERMLEEHLYFALMHARWVDDANFIKGPAQFFKSVPAPLRPLVQYFVRRDVNRMLQRQGMGRHTPAEIAELARRDLTALSAILGDQDYLLGSQPCGADATAFAFVAGCLSKVFETPLRSCAESLPNLVAYESRLMNLYYPGFRPTP